jgi:membrane protein DedA with SNARE-associated domain
VSEVTDPAVDPLDADSEPAAPPFMLRPADVCCGLGLAAGIVASYVFIGLTPSLLAHHGLVLEALAGTNAAIVSGGAHARVGDASLALVVLAPICTILLYDIFYWWAGVLWGHRVAEFYAANNPRVGKWIVRAESWVRRGGVWTLVVGYYLPIPNNVIFLACGTSGMPVWVFLVGDLIGLMLWVGLLVGLGWAIGHPAVHFVNQIGHYSLWITIALVVVIVAGASLRARRMVGRRR